MPLARRSRQCAPNFRYSSLRTSVCGLPSMAEFLEQVRNPAFPFTVRELSSFLLPVTGTLLGLVYAGLIYWFQGALGRLQYSHAFLEDILASHGKVLLDFLVGASLLALFAYFDMQLLTSLSFWGFATLVTLDLLRVTAERGYFVTVFSTKFIPGRYGPVRSFLRKIRNAGPANWWAAIAPFALTVAYPLWINSRTGFAWTLSEQAVSATLLTVTGISLLQIRSLLVEAIHTRKAIEERLQSSSDERIQQLDQPEVAWDRTKRALPGF